MSRFKPKAQSLNEYLILISILIIAFSAMQVYGKRGVQAAVKRASDEFGLQLDSATAQFDDPNRGYLIESHSLVDSNNKTIKQEQSGGGEKRVYGDDASDEPWKSKTEIRDSYSDYISGLVEESYVKGEE